jgi:hypothetical protein
VAEDSGRSDSINGGIFINYRRVDTGMHARRLYERLTNSFTPSHVFMDVVSIEPGLNFRETIARRFDQCTVLLALISDKWSTGEGQKRRLSDPTDMVRLEIEMALERSLRVIPILFDGAKLPSRRRLPESLRVLHDLQAIEMDSFPLTFSNSRLSHFGLRLWIDSVGTPGRLVRRGRSYPRSGSEVTLPRAAAPEGTQACAG